MKLTDAKIKGLKPIAGSRYSKTDGGGLFVDVTSGGVKTWMFQYRLNGKREKVSLGRYPQIGLADARKMRDALAVKVANGISPRTEKKLAKSGLTTDPTVREFGERYFKEQIAVKYKDPSDLRRYLDKEIFPALGAKKIKDVLAADVQRIVYLKRDHGLPMAGVALRGVMKRMFDYAVEWHLVDINPATQVATRFIGTARRRTRALSAKEIRVYLRTLYQSNIRRQFKLALHLILLTMVRKSELLLAEWKDVDLKAGEWQIPASHTKTGAPHIVHLSTQAVELFQNLVSLSGDSLLVLPGRSSNRKPFASNALNQALDGLTFDMDTFTIHDMRRTASTLLHGKGWPADAIELALGHQIGGIRGIYNVADYAKERKEMLQWWGTYVDGLINESNLIEGSFRRA